MKKLILCLLLALFCTTISAEVKRGGDIFKVEQTTKPGATKTKYTWEDKQGNKYPIFITERGACYILKISKKTGKEYKYYLPKEIQAQIKQEMGIQVQEQ